MNQTSRPTRRRRLALAAALLGALALAAPALGASTLRRPPTTVTRTIPLGGLPDALALDAGAGRAFVADDAGATVAIVDLADARLLRTVAVGQPGALAPLSLAVDTRAHRLFAANRGDDGAPSLMRVLDSRDGAPVATLHVGPGADAVAVDARAGHAFVATEGDGAVSMLDARTGRLLRAVAVAPALAALAVDERTARAFVVGAATLPGREVVGDQVGLVGVLDAGTGALLRTVVAGHRAGAVAVDEGRGRVFVANEGDDTVSVLDAGTGEVLRTVAVGWAPSAVAVDERRGRVFVVDAGDGTISVLDSRDGAPLRTQALFEGGVAGLIPPYALAIDEARGRVYVTAWGPVTAVGVPTGDGLLAALDARDGHLLRTLTVGVAPRAVAVEAGSGRVVVVDGGGVFWAPQGWAEQWRQRLVGWAPWLGRVAPPAPHVVRAPGAMDVIDPRA